MSLADDLLTPVSSDLVSVSLPVRGVDVLIKPMTIAEREEFEILKKGDVTNNHISAFLIYLSVVDDSGDKVFKKDQIKQIKDNWPGRDMDALVEAISNLNIAGNG